MKQYSVLTVKNHSIVREVRVKYVPAAQPTLLEKLNDFFGLEGDTAGQKWFYGVFILGGSLFALLMIMHFAWFVA
ncbi:hypothetical protein [Bacillus paramobilis]|uniref:hypothetical protein n=1 Tax=Bacillus paramobilis TaxID=2817477 RepID=UPI001BB30633|nr:hypothetical protein [Bacillus paramobilis]HEF5065761.1 hypothetical protein [Bacillus cereus]HEF5237745.1 hypothetical protein [Bacillus cereus]